jgi:hypothetical protein
MRATRPKVTADKNVPNALRLPSLVKTGMEGCAVLVAEVEAETDDVVDVFVTSEPYISRLTLVRIRENNTCNKR